LLSTDGLSLTDEVRAEIQRMSELADSDDARHRLNDFARLALAE
jgi:hypothetical protein